MKSGSFRFSLLAIGLLCIFLFLCLRNFPDNNPETRKKLKGSDCLLLAASPYFTNGRKVSGSQNLTFFTDKEIQKWAAALRKRFPDRILLFYLPLHRTKDQNFLISKKDFFPFDSGFLKISHHEFSYIQNILQPKNQLATLKGFLKHFPKADLFLDVFETDSQKAFKSLTPLIKQTVFISSNNEDLLDLLSKERLFKTFYPFKYLVRLALARLIQKDLAVPGAGLLLPQKWMPEAAVREILRQQKKMLFLKTTGPFKKTDQWKGFADGIIIPLKPRESVSLTSHICPSAVSFNLF